MARALFAVAALGLGLALLVGPALAQTSMSPDMAERLKKADKNGDGRIDRGEFQELVIESFYFKDKDRRGYLVMEQVREISPEVFRAADKNGDGRLTLEEYLNAFFKDFDAADVDKDGSVTIEELDVYMRARK